MNEENEQNMELDEFRKSLEHRGTWLGRFEAYKDLHSYISERLRELFAESERLAKKGSQNVSPEEAAHSLEHIYNAKAKYNAYYDILKIVSNKIDENEISYENSGK